MPQGCYQHKGAEFMVTLGVMKIERDEMAQSQ